MRAARVLPLVVALTVGVSVSAPMPTAAASSCPAPGGGTLPALPAHAGEVSVRGRGFGHGTGLSQYGTWGAAVLGCTASEILATYYPGTTVGTANDPARFRVSLNTRASGTRTVAVDGPITWELCRVGGSCQQLPFTQAAGEAWRIVTNEAQGSWYIYSGSSTTPKGHYGGDDYLLRAVLTRPGASSPGPRLRVHDGTFNYRYRWGLVEFDSYVPSGTSAYTSYLTVELDSIERYLYGLAEMPSSWNLEALKTQAMAGRTYGLYQHGIYKGNRAGCRCDVYATTSDQKYTGYEKEGESGSKDWGRIWTSAVDATSGRVVLYKDRLIPAYYSSSHGGHSESFHFWQGRDIPYLQPVDDSAWEQAVAHKNTRVAWQQSFTANHVGSLFGVGRVLSIQTHDPRGARGRVGNPAFGYGGVEITGTTGTVTVPGTVLRSRLGIPSNLVDVAVSVPPPGAVRVVGDWNGDGVDTPGWFKDGTWGLYDRNDAGGTTRILNYGRAGDVPVVGDWNGDGRDTIGVVRGGDTWILRYEYRAGADIIMTYGRPGDIPVTGDWNGDGRDTIGVVRGNTFILRYEYRSGADIVLEYGRDTDTPLTGDFNGDGRDTIGVVRGNTFILRYRYRSGADIVLDYGRSTDTPLTGDWNGDGTDTLGVVRGHRWILRYVYRSGADYVFDY